MKSRLILINGFLVIAGLFTVIWFYAMQTENGDKNTASMYLAVFLFPVIIYVTLNTFVLSYLIRIFKSKKIASLTFFVTPVISWTILIVTDWLTPSNLFNRMTMYLCAVNVITYTVYFRQNQAVEPPNASS